MSSGFAHEHFRITLFLCGNSKTVRNCLALWLLMERPFLSHARSAWWRRRGQRNRPNWGTVPLKLEDWEKFEPKCFPEISVRLALNPHLAQNYTCKIWQNTFNPPDPQTHTTVLQLLPTTSETGEKGLRAESHYRWFDFFLSFMDHRFRLFWELLQKKKGKEFNIITLVMWLNRSVETSTCSSSSPSSHASSSPRSPELNVLTPSSYRLGAEDKEVCRDNTLPLFTGQLVEGQHSGGPVSGQDSTDDFISFSTPCLSFSCHYCYLLDSVTSKGWNRDEKRIKQEGRGCSRWDYSRFWILRFFRLHSFFCNIFLRLRKGKIASHWRNIVQKKIIGHIC